LALGSARAQDKTKPVLRVSCTAAKLSYTAIYTIDLTVTLENVGPSDFYIYRNVEWGWAGIWFKLVDAKGNTIRPKKHFSIAPLPPPPVYDKSQLVSLARGYFYGTHLQFDLSPYAPEPGSYGVEVSYQSNYHNDQGFGLPILTSDDGTFPSNTVGVEIHTK
jgi:hypothetical protein